MLTRFVQRQNVTGVRIVAAVVPVAAVPLLVWLFRASRLWRLPDVGEPFDIESFRQFQVDANHNAWIDYTAAESLLTGEPSKALYDNGLFMPELSWDTVSAEDREWLEQNRPALDRWSAGTEKSDALRVLPRRISLNDAVGGVHVGTLWSTLSRLESLRLQSAGDFEAAWAWHRAFFRYTRHRGRLDSEIERQVGICFHSAAVQRIVEWSERPDATAEQIEAALEQVRDDFRITESLSNTIRIEYLLAIQEAELPLEDYGPLEEFPDLFGTSLPKPPTALGRFLSNEPEVTHRLLNHQVANLLAIVDKPRAEWPQRLRSDVSYFVLPSNRDDRQLSAVEFERQVRGSPLAQLCLLNVLSHGSVIRELATQGLLELALAAQWYRRLHNEFPQTVGQLVEEGMLPSVPIDPWSRGGRPLNLRRDETDSSRTVIWSIGDNRTDDGGNIALGQGHDPLDQGYMLGSSD